MIERGFTGFGESAFYPHQTRENAMPQNSAAELSAAEAALGRSRLYEVLGRLYHLGLTPELLPYAAGIPQLVAALPADRSADEAAADHHALFAFNVFPYQSIFLDPTGLLGGAESARVQAAYARSGFQVDASDASPDHLAFELGFLAFLCGAEADAWTDALPGVAVEMRQRQAAFLGAHLLRWLGPFVEVVSRQAFPLYAALADLTLMTVADHAAALDITATHRTLNLTLPDPPDLLKREETGLGDIAAYLLTPPHSGIFLTRDDIGRLGRRFDLPRGFGERRHLLANLLRAAVTYETFPDLCIDLAAMFTVAGRRYMAMAADHPALVPWMPPWTERASQTATLLETLAGEAERLG